MNDKALRVLSSVKQKASEVPLTLKASDLWFAPAGFKRGKMNVIMAVSNVGKSFIEDKLKSGEINLNLDTEDEAVLMGSKKEPNTYGFDDE